MVKPEFLCSLADADDDGACSGPRDAIVGARGPAAGAEAQIS
jgi:hypothetical protein